MAAPITDHNLLTLEYWQNSVTYEGKTVPSGTIGCEVLNISDTLWEELAQASIPLRKIVAAIGENKLTAELLRPAKDSILRMIRLAKATHQMTSMGVPAVKLEISVGVNSGSLPPTIPLREYTRRGSIRSRNILDAARWTSRPPP